MTRTYIFVNTHECAYLWVNHGCGRDVFVCCCLTLTSPCLLFYSHKGTQGLHVLWYSLLLVYRLGYGLGTIAAGCPILGAVVAVWQSLLIMSSHPWYCGFDVWSCSHLVKSVQGRGLLFRGLFPWLALGYGSNYLSHPNLRINLSTINHMCAPGIVAHTSRQITNVSSQVSYITLLQHKYQSLQQAEIKHISS